ncbi:MAG: ribosomal L7Ae/L30e/S12e/Gadd45 family protein [Clostridia bacterium]|nr:ribosomal L7Ae/L30e/S12e/Gadd45 family protein [Clostridia bacterium]
MNSKFLSMLGLAKRAGALITGTDLVTKALPSGRIKLVMYAENSSQNTEKKITDKCKFYGIRCVKIAYNGEDIAHAIGKLSSVCVIGVNDENFSNQLFTLISKETR